jgi:tetratricopeptide (TPR) repeat protein
MLTRHGAWVMAMCLLAQVAWNLDEQAIAAKLYNALLPFSGRLIIIGSGASCYGPVARHLALAAATMRRYDDAERHFRAALDMDSALNARPFTAYTQMEYAFMLAARNEAGDRQRAAALCREAVETAQELGLREVISRGSELLGRLST